MHASFFEKEKVGYYSSLKSRIKSIAIVNLTQKWQLNRLSGKMPHANYGGI